jgi:hypothetical protein
MTTQIGKTLNQRVPSVPAALKALATMRRELSSKKTYTEIRQTIKQAEAFKVLQGHVFEVKKQAEDTILIANKRIAEELESVQPEPYRGGPKKRVDAQVKPVVGKEATGIHPKQRSRLKTLANAPDEEIEHVADELRAEGKDATPNAVVTRIKQHQEPEPPSAPRPQVDDPEGSADERERHCAAADDGVEVEHSEKEEDWRRSVASLAGDMIAMRASFKKEFGDAWETFSVDSALVTLAKQAATVWTELAAELRDRFNVAQRAATAPPPSRASTHDDLNIPDFLRRKKAPSPANG